MIDLRKNVPSSHSSPFSRPPLHTEPIAEKPRKFGIEQADDGKRRERLLLIRSLVSALPCLIRCRHRASFLGALGVRLSCWRKVSQKSIVGPDGTTRPTDTLVSATAAARCRQQYAAADHVRLLASSSSFSGGCAAAVLPRKDCPDNVMEPHPPHSGHEPETTSDFGDVNGGNEDHCDQRSADCEIPNRRRKVAPQPHRGRTRRGTEPEERQEFFEKSFHGRSSVGRVRSSWSLSSKNRAASLIFAAFCKCSAARFFRRAETAIASVGKYPSEPPMCDQPSAGALSVTA